jgi:5-methylcytosine-specific restriction endonuclease McrA
MEKILAKNISADQLSKLYLDENLPIREIAKRFNCSPTLICKKLKTLNIHREKTSSSKASIIWAEDVRGTSKYLSWTREVIERDNHVCKLCEAKTNLIVHHIIPLNVIVKLQHKRHDIFELLLYDLTNGLTLCKDCHKELHKATGTNRSNISRYLMI